MPRRILELNGHGCRLTHKDQLLATNEHDLTIHDEIQPTLNQHLRTLLRPLIVPT